MTGKRGGSWTPERREAQRQLMKKLRAEKLAKDAAKPAKAEVASIKHTSSDDVKKLMEEIEGLKAKLKISERKRTDAEEQALKLAESQGMLLANPVEEVPTGKFVGVRVLDVNAADTGGTGYKVVGHKEDGRDILRPVFKTVKVPTYFYKIDMPPVGGTDLKINGNPFYHGTVYEFDADTLRTVKDMVFNVWKHERSIHSTEENAYRKPLNVNASVPGALQAAIQATQQRLRG